MRVVSLFLCLITLLVLPASAHQSPLPAAQAFRLNWTREGDRVRLNWRMPKGYYLYRAYIEATDATGRPLTVTTAKGQTISDPTFGRVEVYYRTATATIRHTGDIRLSYRGCQQDGLCYMPVSLVILTAKSH